MAKKYRIIIRETHCKQCGICSTFCPKQVFRQELGQTPVVVNEDACIGCQLCRMRCPDFAIDVEERV